MSYYSSTFLINRLNNMENEKKIRCCIHTYPLLTECEVRTVSYRPSFFTVDLGLDQKPTGNNENP